MPLALEHRACCYLCSETKNNQDLLPTEVKRQK